MSEVEAVTTAYGCPLIAYAGWRWQRFLAECRFRAFERNLLVDPLEFAKRGWQILLFRTLLLAHPARATGETSVLLRLKESFPERLHA